jgi:DNA-binding MarR family transcriptional regulator
MANKGQELHYKNKRTDVYPNSRLTHKQVQEIKARYAKGKLLQSRLAEIYGVNKSTISRIVKGDTWGHHA